MGTFRLNTPDEIIEIVQAFKEGKAIQFIQPDDSGDVWYDTDKPAWDFQHNQYRIKPQRPRAFYGGKYYYVSTDLRVVCTVDGDSTNLVRYLEDTNRYESGNYFIKKGDAEAFLAKIKAFVGELINIRI